MVTILEGDGKSLKFLLQDTGFQNQVMRSAKFETAKHLSDTTFVLLSELIVSCGLTSVVFFSRRIGYWRRFMQSAGDLAELRQLVDLNKEIMRYIAYIPRKAHLSRIFHIYTERSSARVENDIDEVLRESTRECPINVSFSNDAWIIRDATTFAHEGIGE